jgi:hypothetical protein
MSWFSKVWETLKTNTTYRGKVREVLMSREASKINFTALGVTISGTIFPIIADDITGDKPTRAVVVQSSFQNGVAAQYHTDTNVMDVGLDPANSRFWKGSVIHEAVHAWIDRSKLTPTAVDNEAVAYIAESIYYRRVGMARSRIGNPIHLSARDIANTILSGGTPSNQSLQTLKSNIMANTNYSSLTATTVYAADG